MPPGSARQLSLSLCVFKKRGTVGGNTITMINASRENYISQIVRRHNVRRLIHFTKYENLRSIMKSGLCTRECLLTEGMKYIPNDENRFDSSIGAICLSISSPNYRMLYKYRKQNGGHWVVLCLNASILWKLKCLYCWNNASSIEIRTQPRELLQHQESIERIFAVGSDQAEVLVEENISTKLIDEIIFDDFSLRENFRIQNKDIQTDYYDRGSCFWGKWPNAE